MKFELNLVVHWLTTTYNCAMHCGRVRDSYSLMHFHWPPCKKGVGRNCNFFLRIFVLVACVKISIYIYIAKIMGHRQKLSHVWGETMAQNAYFLSLWPIHRNTHILSKPKLYISDRNSTCTFGILLFDSLWWWFLFYFLLCGVLAIPGILHLKCTHSIAVMQNQHR